MENKIYQQKRDSCKCKNEDLFKTAFMYTFSSVRTFLNIVYLLLYYSIPFYVIPIRSNINSGLPEGRKMKIDKVTPYIPRSTVPNSRRAVKKIKISTFEQQEIKKYSYINNDNCM